MIRVCLFGNHAYGYDVTNWEEEKPEDPYFYTNKLDEDLLERINQGDIVMYFATKESAKEWCRDNELEYEFVEPDDNN